MRKSPVEQLVAYSSMIFVLLILVKNSKNRSEWSQNMLLLEAVWWFQFNKFI